mmetsp:Transcript_87223/g.242864  ORF Transcript_87223/g.242864 Transcript_87223/m.242864 type:complete len:161 (+) Transcript_87223:479-961(+)
MASGSFDTALIMWPGTSTEKTSLIASDILSGTVCSGEMSIIRLIKVQMRVLHNSLSPKRSRFFLRSIASAAVIVLCTKIALMTLKRPTVMTKANKQHPMLAGAPYSLLMCSKSGVPADDVQSPKLQRNVVNIDRGTESKNRETEAPSLRPNTSRKTKLTK